jgi:hypothetical protein
MPDLSTIVTMLMICWVPVSQPHASPTLKEVWRFEKQMPLDQCLIMNRMASGGGSAAAITVRCGDGFDQKGTPDHG